MKKKKNYLYDKFMEEGYASINDFINRSGVTITFETVRTAVYEGKHISFPALIVLMKYLNFTADEIKAKLEELGEREFSSLIGTQRQIKLAEWEQAALQFFRRYRKKETAAMWNSIVNIIKSVAENAETTEEGKDELEATVKKLYLRDRRERGW